MKILSVYILSILSFLCLAYDSSYPQTNSWYSLPGAPVASVRFEDIYFINDYTGWVVGGIGANGIVQKTTDGGTTWLVADTLLNSFPRCVAFINSSTGWIGTLNINFRFYKTTDGGFTWEDVILPSPTPQGLCGLYVLNDNYIFGTGAYYGSPIFIKTTNGGITWTTKAMNNYAKGLVDCYFFDSDIGILVGSRDTLSVFNRSVVLFTSDGGNTWESKYIGVRLDEQCWKISFPNSITGYVSMERSGSGEKRFLKTTNSGINWIDLPFPNVRQQGVGFINENTGWIGGANFTYGTTDGGSNWFNSNFGVNINRIRFLNDSLGYAIGQTVYKYGNAVSITTISSITSDFNLHQNYPNPFNPSTRIRFDILRKGFTELHIYDIKGNKISAPVSRILDQGSYEIEWRAEDLSSGVYFYRLVLDGNVLYSKRMILSK